ncbi:hypothetical protein SKAU_G00054120 [Synaphobranchus kaupii]|uniref:Uncharacterized protein n=1 Tax=Synaphobranchus kaupii TaxID=118154 RepID=A0A9Q1G4N3_SYNKA|nr:hypothetical protein SKAU_G00054120 [Synaphobranchus kaupii]
MNTFGAHRVVLVCCLCEREGTAARPICLRACLRPPCVRTANGGRRDSSPGAVPLAAGQGPLWFRTEVRRHAVVGAG